MIHTPAAAVKLVRSPPVVADVVMLHTPAVAAVKLVRRPPVVADLVMIHAPPVVAAV